jgi:hypothetical protein
MRPVRTTHHLTATRASDFALPTFTSSLYSRCVKCAQAHAVTVARPRLGRRRKIGAVVEDGVAAADGGLGDRMPTTWL